MKILDYLISWKAVGIGAVICVNQYLYLVHKQNKKFADTDYTRGAFNILLRQKEIAELLGPPINHFVNHVTSNNEEQTDLKINLFVSGKISDGFLTFNAKKFSDEWFINNLEFEFADKVGGKFNIKEMQEG